MTGPEQTTASATTAPDAPPTLSRPAIAPATEADVPVILAFIRGLAEYEKLANACVATEADLRRTLFGPRPFAEVLIARVGQTHVSASKPQGSGDEPAGFALFFHNYSTFLAKPGIYLEDLFVWPRFRGHGVGKALLRALAALARDRGCGRLEWSVLDWNESAIGFYRRMGADVLPDWRICRVAGDRIAALADGRPGGDNLVA